MKREIKYLILNGQKVIREKDAFRSLMAWEKKHPHALAIYRGHGQIPMRIDEITKPFEAWLLGYKQAVRDQRKLIKQEYEPLD